MQGPVDRKTRVRGGGSVRDPRLARLAPPDRRHEELYPLRALASADRPRCVPVVLGVNFYRNFFADRLVEKTGAGGVREWWVREGDLGPLMGGHAIVAEPFVKSGGPRDIDAWWRWYDQVQEGICVSEAVSRCATLLNRKRYQPRPLYDVAQQNDEWPGEAYDGTSVRAGLWVAMTYGLVPARPGEPHYVGRGQVTRPFVAAEGIAAYRWALTDDELFATLGRPDAQWLTWLNSWGRSGYPHRVKVPRSVIARLRREDGEVGIVTDR